MNIFLIAIVVLAVFTLGLITLLIKWYRKPINGQALVRTGKGGTHIVFDRGIFVIPVIHRMEVMDITIKTVTIQRTGIQGLICKDNMRADIHVTFFVRINHTVEDAKNVALSIGCDRASHQDTLMNLFEAKFSEALKTVGKRFNFVDLYSARDEFKREILQIIGKDLNGYHLDDCAIDFLEQTSLDVLKRDNILDAEGIKKITELTATQQILANQIERDREKTLTKQNVDAKETILALNRHLAEKEEVQKREIANIKDREQAEIRKVSEKQRQTSEEARISAEEAIQVAEQNKDRQIIVAQRNKERTDGVEIEKTKRDIELQSNERERVVALAQIEKDKAVEEEKKNIQEVIRERVSVEKAVVVEEQKIKDTIDFATAERAKRVAIVNSESEAEANLVKQIKTAEAAKKSAELLAEKRIIEAQTNQDASLRDSEAQKIMAQAKVVQEAAIGLSEAQVMEAKAIAKLKQGETDAKILEMNASAESKGIELKAMAEAKRLELVVGAEVKGMNLKNNTEADKIRITGLARAESEKQIGISEADVVKAKAVADQEKGLAEALVVLKKLEAEAEGIRQKAESMKQLNEAGKDHEEFKLKLDKEKQVELAEIHIKEAIAKAQAEIISQALKTAKIDIVGGETMFFDRIIGAVSWGKSIDRFADNSMIAKEVKKLLFGDKENKEVIVEKEVEKNTPEDITEHEEIVEPVQETPNETVHEELDPYELISEFTTAIKELFSELKISKDDKTKYTISELLDIISKKNLSEVNKSLVQKLITAGFKKGYGKMFPRILGI